MVVNLEDIGIKEQEISRLVTEQREERDKQALDALLRTPLGRWFIMRLFDRTGVLSDSFTGNSKSFYLEGMRKVGLMYINDINKLGVDAVKLKQKGEIEYYEKMLEFKAILNGSKE